MLILTRRLGETLRIGEDVIVLGRSGNQVKLGIRAPTTIAVHRTELFEHIHRGRMAHPSTVES